MEHIALPAFGIVLVACWLAAEIRWGAWTRIVLGLICIGIAATAWIRAEMRATRLETLRRECGRAIGFFAEYGDPEKVQRAVDVLLHSDPDEPQEFDYWAEEAPIVEQIGELGGWATPCDRLDPRACVHAEFRNAKMDAATLERLGRLPRIGTLILQDTPITDEGLQFLANLTQLQHLSLANTQITDAGLQYLKGMTQLEWLNLDSTQVSDAGLEQIKRLPKLERLVLTHTDVTDEGVKRLRETLPDRKIER